MASDLDEAVAIPEMTTPALKTIYLIRHAESDENRRLGSLGRIVQGCTSLTRPNKSDLVASMELLNVQAQIDSDVSEVGRRQVSNSVLNLVQSFTYSLLLFGRRNNFVFK